MSTELDIPHPDDVAPLNESDARSMTDETKRDLGAVRVKIAYLYLANADEALGYGSWDEYRRAEFAGMGLKLDTADERRRIVEALDSMGYPTRAIAAAVGASVGTISGDLRRSKLNGQDPKPAPKAAPDDDEVIEPTNVIPPEPPLAPEPPPVKKPPEKPTGTTSGAAKPPPLDAEQIMTDAKRHAQALREELRKLTVARLRKHPDHHEAWAKVLGDVESDLATVIERITKAGDK